ncbi:hypothetical protein [Actinomadura luteofluorescens]|uniref:hypothetical protein n=1 Tax=Actinomadura luteofluorescens TaxID=46163 RepID=UPI003D900191
MRSSLARSGVVYSKVPEAGTAVNARTGAAARPPTSANSCGAIPGGTARSVTNRDDQDWLLYNRARCAGSEL